MSDSITITKILPSDLTLHPLAQCSNSSSNGLAYRGLWHVESGSQHRLEEKHIVTALCDKYTIDLDSDFPGGRENVNAFVWVFGMTVDRLIFFEPSVCLRQYPCPKTNDTRTYLGHRIQCAQDQQGVPFRT